MKSKTLLDALTITARLLQELRHTRRMLLFWVLFPVLLLQMDGLEVQGAGTGAEALALPRSGLSGGPGWGDLFRPGAVPAAPLGVAWIDALLFHSLALSAWKQQGAARWSLRVNPSSGNLHPTEAYLLAPAIDGLSPGPGLYHYSPLLHALERRAAVDPDTWAALCGGLPAPCLLLGLSTIAWRATCRDCCAAASTLAIASLGVSLPRA